MGTKRTIKKQTGYPTSDGSLHEKYSEAIKHQSGIDLNDACEGDPDIESAQLIRFLKENLNVVTEYIKYNLTEKKPAAPKKEKPASAPAKPAKPAVSAKAAVKEPEEKS